MGEIAMGWGDELIGSGLARGCAAAGKRMAFGTGRRIVWSLESHAIFKGNPNIAPPGSEQDDDLVWCAHYGGNRLYGSYVSNRWRWRNFQCVPGEVFLTEEELDVDQDIGIVIEGRTKNKPNKQWPVVRYQTVADMLVEQGYTVSQLVGPGQKPLLRGVQRVVTSTFRHALGALSKASLYIGAEGGLHHGAAALGVPAVVLFGGFIGPETTGYASHVNLTGGAKACGSSWRCSHCKQAMDNISVDEVVSSALDQLKIRGLPNDLEIQSPTERRRIEGICQSVESQADRVVP